MIISYDVDYYHGDDIKYIYGIQIQYPEDLKSFSKVISQSDLIQLHTYSYYNNLIVDKVEYVEEPEKSIIVTGKYFPDDDFHSLSIKLNDIFYYQTLFLGKIDSFQQKYSLYKIYKESVSDLDLQQKCFTILHRLMNKDMEKIVFGKDVISNIKDDLVHVVLVNWTFLKQQDQQWFSLLTDISHKIKRANIVVIDKGTELYEELKNYGGIVGVLF